MRCKVRNSKEQIMNFIGVLFILGGLFLGSKTFYINDGRWLIETGVLVISLISIGIGLLIITGNIINLINNE